MKKKAGRPKSVFKIEGEVVGFDELGPNPNNPYEYVDKETRNDLLGQHLVDMILSAARGQTHQRENDKNPSPCASGNQE